MNEIQLPIRHVTAGRIQGIEYTLCGVRILPNNTPAAPDAPECVTCKNLDC